MSYLSQALELPQSNAALATQGMTWLFSKLMPDSFFADQQYQDDARQDAGEHRGASAGQGQATQTRTVRLRAGDRTTLNFDLTE